MANVKIKDFILAVPTTTDLIPFSQDGNSRNVQVGDLKTIITQDLENELDVLPIDGGSF